MKTKYLWMRLLSLVTIAALLLTACDEELIDDSGSSNDTPTQAAGNRPTSTPRAGNTSVDPNLPQWTIMLYQDADDEILEEDIMYDFNEAERIGSTDQVQIVAQVDRYEGAFDGMGDWTSTKRFLLQQDDNLYEIGSEEIEDLGEANMADKQTLVDFVVWAAQNYPAQKYALILSDHGAGWPGGWMDPDPGGLGADNVYMAKLFGVDGLWLMEIDQALEEARAALPTEKFEFIGMDACLMASLEVFTALAPHAHYAVASQELEPAVGWAYTSFLEELTQNPQVGGDVLGKTIVNTYIVNDQRIVDSEARALFQPGVSANALAREIGQDITLSAIDLGQVGQVANALDNLAATLTQIDQAQVDEARTYAQAFDNIFNPDLPSPYIDLGHFAYLLKDANINADVTSAADGVLAALQQAVIAEIHGPKRAGASGITVYFPVSKLYGNHKNFEYTTIAARFANDYQWDEFLQFTHTGEGGVVTRAPQEFKINPIEASSDTADVNNPVTLKTTVTGKNVGYIYTFFGRVDTDLNVLIIEDQDFLFPSPMKTVDGVTYPDWPAGRIDVNYEWKPVLYGISDGNTVVKALLSPDTFGEAPVYIVEGNYTFAQSGQTHYAEMYFQYATPTADTGELIQIFGYSNLEGTGAPREITPKKGDKFTVLDQGYYLDDAKQDDYYYGEAGTITYGDAGFTAVDVEAVPGDYVIGFIVEDLDGNYVEEYVSVTVN